MALLFTPHLEPSVSFFSRYTSGDVRVWDTRTWDYTAPFLESEFEEDEPGMQPYVSFVRINSSLAVAAYEDGKQPSSLLRKKKSLTKIKQLWPAPPCNPSIHTRGHTHMFTHIHSSLSLCEEVGQ